MKKKVCGIFAATFPLCIILIVIGINIQLSIILWLLIATIISRIIISINLISYIEYTFKDKTLHLHKRDSSLKELIKMKRYVETTAVYKPAEIVYTSATVGGITTGGVHVNEAHYDYYSSKTNEDKFGLYYNDRPIEKIVCDFDIEDHPAINQFKVNKNTIVISYHKSKKEMDTLGKMMYKNAVSTGDQGMQCHILNKKIMEDKISRNDCKNIIKWISGKI